MALCATIVGMIPRRLLPALTAALAEVPAVALLGLRKVGKTTLALAVASSRPSVCLDLESETGWAKLAEPELPGAAKGRPDPLGYRGRL